MNYRKIKILKNYYENTLNIYKSGPKAVNWKDKKSQELRFKKICEIDDLNNKKILDVGCGLGHLAEFLYKKKVNVAYKGLDISKNMISEAVRFNKKRNVKFFCKDILKINNNDIKKFKSDYVVNCGLFTVKDVINSKEWWGYIKKMIINMSLLSKLGMSFNLMKYNIDYKEKHLHYQSIDELINFVEKNISKKIIIKNDYKLWEYTCFIYK